MFTKTNKQKERHIWDKKKRSRKLMILWERRYKNDWILEIEENLKENKKERTEVHHRDKRTL